jgi:hypothetical protein
MDLDDIRQFERDLDRALDARWTPSSGRDALVLSLKVIEAAHRSSPSAGRGFLRDGLSVLADRYVLSDGTGEPDVESLIHDLLFGFHYYMLREYFYYRYNRPSATTWQRTGRDISIGIADRTLTRQFFHTTNRWFIESKKRFETYNGSSRINELLRAAGGSVHGEITGEFAELVMYEADLKLGAYYDLLEPSADISLGPYTYADFYQVYRQLLGNALVHRYISRLEENPTMVTFSREDLEQRLSSSTGRPIGVCRAILADMVLDAHAVAERLNAVHFALFGISDGEIGMAPTDFLLHEGLVSTLRVVAQRRAGHFLTHVSGPLSDALTRRVCTAFNAAGLVATRNVSLAHIDQSLPDIDVMAVSEERTLGYVVYVIETKNPLPPQWAKDQLRAVHEDNIPKGVAQLDRLLTFFGTPAGASFLRQRLPRHGIPHFGHEFVIAVKALIVTSDSVGMLMDDSPYPIIDYRTLERILARADGDVVYINWALGELDAMADRGTKITTATVVVGDWTVTYEGVAIEGILEFEKHTYKAEGVDRQLAEDFIAAGHHPYDVLVRADDDTETTASE